MNWAKQTDVDNEAEPRIGAGQELTACIAAAKERMLVKSWRTGGSSNLFTFSVSGCPCRSSSLKFRLFYRCVLSRVGCRRSIFECGSPMSTPRSLLRRLLPSVGPSVASFPSTILQVPITLPKSSCCLFLKSREATRGSRRRHPQVVWQTEAIGDASSWASWAGGPELKRLFSATLSLAWQDLLGRDIIVHQSRMGRLRTSKRMKREMGFPIPPRPPPYTGRYEGAVEKDVTFDARAHFSSTLQVRSELASSPVLRGLGSN